MPERPNNQKGGTLIEVLVSLVIVTLVLSSVLEVTSYRRRVLTDAVRNRDAGNLAMTWQSARLHDLPWSHGDSGGFPGRDDMRWFIERITATGASSDSHMPGEPTDDAWRRLQVVHLDRGTETATAFIFRLDVSVIKEEERGREER